MNTTDLIKEISAETGKSQKDVKEVVDAFVSIVRNRLVFGIDVMIKNLISFKLMTTEAHKKHDISSGQMIDVPKKYRVKMILATDLKKKIQDKTVYEGK